MNHKFSIILPTFNRSKYISIAVKSVLAQTYPFFELIIVDDGSTDNTKQILQEFKDKRIKYFWKINEERGAARNFGIAKSTGAFVCFLDSDDYYYNNHLSVLNQLISTYPGVFYHLSYQIVDENDKVLGKKEIHNEITIEKIKNVNIFSMNATCIKTEIAQQFPFSEDRNFCMGEDLHLWLRLLVRFRVYSSPVITSAIVEHSGRTLNAINPDKVIYSANKLHDLLVQDREFIKVVPNGIPKVLAYFYSTASYFYMRKKESFKGVKALLKAVQLDYRQLFEPRTLSIFYRFLKPN